jgi:GT2 family glycosyltransferase
MERLSVIIVSWNVRTLLDGCLTSLRADLERADIQPDVWVVDNASQDASAALVHQRHPWVQLEALNENLGFVRANNRVLRRLMAQTTPPDFVWLLNPDTVVSAGSAATLIDVLAAHPRAGLVGPKLQNPDGSLQQSAFRFPRLLQILFDLGHLPRRFYRSRWNGRYSANDYAKSSPFRIDHPLGAAMMARTQAIAEVGLLDEDFFMYCEEIDWAWRMKKAGWDAWLVPDAEVIHYGGASTKQARPQMTAHLWRSRARLYRKHHGPLTRTLAGWLVRAHFRRQTATSPAWAKAYREIVEAWS